MSLPVPQPGEDPGPQWATDLNACLTIVDAHDHTSGLGVQITPNGLNINSDLSFNSNNLTAARTVRMSEQSATLSLPTDLLCIYAVSDDLYYNDGNGTAVRITQSGAVAGTPGSIANLVSPATATYVGGSTSFVWQSNTNTPAHTDQASAILRNLTANSKSLTLSPPAAMGADFTIVLPNLPGSGSKFVSMDSSGNMGATWAVDSTTIEVNSNVVQVKASGITPTQLAADSVTTVKILNSNVTTAKIADSNVTTAKIADLNVTRPKLVAVGQQVSSSSSTFSTSSATFVDVTNLTVTITTTGRPVMVIVQNDGTGNQTFFGGSKSTSAVSTGCIFRFMRDATEIARYGLTMAVNGVSGATGSSLYSGPILHLDTPSAGTYTYKLQIQGYLSSTAAAFQLKLLAYEL
jgi:hypothetical protein